MTIWTEGVCGDGVAILRDGEMVPITELLAHLNGAKCIPRSALADIEIILETLVGAFRDDAFEGKAVMTMTSCMGSNFHKRVERAYDAISDLTTAPAIELKSEPDILTALPPMEKWPELVVGQKVQLGVGVVRVWDGRQWIKPQP